MTTLANTRLCEVCFIPEGKTSQTRFVKNKCLKCYRLVNKYNFSTEQAMDYLTSYHPRTRKCKEVNVPAPATSLLPTGNKTPTGVVATTTFPKRIWGWECSDGREYTNETDALRHENDLLRDKLRGIR